jgi:hypothetical protein
MKTTTTATFSARPSICPSIGQIFVNSRTVIPPFDVIHAVTKQDTAYSATGDEWHRGNEFV